MKFELRIPTDTYAYVNAEFEGTAEEAKEKYDEIKKTFSSGFGLEPKEWNRVLDKYLADGTMKSEEYETMDAEQKKIIQEIKKSIKRQPK